MKVTEVAISAIDTSDRARKDYGDIEELAENIKAKGLQQPITVIKKEEGFKLAAGGRRLSACEKLEHQTIPAVVREDEVSTSALKEIELIENTLRKDFDWHERVLLEKEIYEMKKAEDPNWSQTKTSDLLGMSKQGMSKNLEMAKAIEMLPELKECESQNEARKKWERINNDLYVQDVVRKQREEAEEKSKEEPDKEPEPTSFKKFDSLVDYIESKYKIEDAFKGLQSLAPDIVSFMEIDPPYAVDLASHRKKAQDQYFAQKYDEMDEDTYPEFLQNLAEETYRVMKPASWGILWYGSKWYAEVCLALHQAGFSFNVTPAIWTKTGGGYSPQPYINLSNLYENFIVFRKGNPALIKPGRGNVFHYSPPSSTEKIHPTERPVELIEELLRTFTTEASVICVPFLGSGNTLVASFNLDRVAFGWDLTTDYKDRLLAKVMET